jgi:endogenous inhibitor of DNA gyrase (YacG/DUF329 family)
MSCPICKKQTDEQYRPFCSMRCADVDLGKWLTGSYAIPAADINEEDSISTPSEPQDQKLH